MEQITTDLKQSRGGRVSSLQLRKSQSYAQEFCGLPDNTSHYDLLVLVKRIGKEAGFTSKMICLLDYYMSFTRNCDWEQGSSPIVYQSISRTARDMGVSERQIQRLEQALFEAGALTWHDSGNHKRYGVRCDKSGRILHAYGADLSPLASLKEDLEDKLRDKKLIDNAWMEFKRKISWYRRGIKSLIAELEEQGDDKAVEYLCQYDKDAITIRAHMSLCKIKDLHNKHKDLYDLIMSYIELSAKRSCRDDNNVAHIENTNNKQSNKLESRDNSHAFNNTSSEVQKRHAEPSEQEDILLQMGLQHLSLKNVLHAASERFIERMPMEQRPMSWNDFIEAAYSLKNDLCISQSSWAEGCAVLSRGGAAICILLIDQGMNREIDPVLRPSGYFNAMIGRAKKGELHLHNSIFGLLGKQIED
ncbi:MAG: hypothetical protein JKY93_12805 [Gammaproteobacteria bacterium]|nr:hypothetical protein [Gammaproteobacteria bacterium]